MKLPHLVIFNIFLLSACGGSDPVADGANKAAALPPPTVINVSDPTGAPPPANSDRPPQPAAMNDVTAPAAAIPASLQGRWGLTPADCTSTQGDAKGLMTVAPDNLLFYESHAVPAGHVQSAADSFSADFAFSGEGQSWTRFQSLELQKGGKLVRTESGPMASYTYAKCQ